MRNATVGLLAVGAVLRAAPLAAAQAEGPRLATQLDVRAGTEVVVHLDVEDRTPLDAPLAVSAATVLVDGREDQEVLLFPGSGREGYEALVGPLPAGRHRIELRPSGLWPGEARLTWKTLGTQPTTPGQPGHDRLRFAPRLGLRADTVGEGTDLPLLAYVEEDTAGGGRRLRYTVVFSNEDGGTPTRALLARWGRATDIEMAYEVVLAADGSVVSERFQGPDHDLRPFQGRRVGAHPVLLVATLNNVFLDRGRSVALVSTVPVPVPPEAGTRESIMDARPWTYRVMAKELEREGKIAPGRGQKPDQVVDDPRWYLYLEARLRLEGAAVAARADLADGTGRHSHEGDARLAIARDGWVRTAVPLGSVGAPLALVAWECLPHEGGLAGAGCEIEATRAFRLDEWYRPGPNLVQPAQLHLRAGQSGSLRLAR